jgi:hypothetical protein
MFRLPRRNWDAAVERLRARMAAERQETAPVKPGRTGAPELPKRTHDALDRLHARMTGQPDAKSRTEPEPPGRTWERIRDPGRGR